MDRKLLVTLLQKNIQELGMITSGFMEMSEYPAVIVKLARQKTEDILDYISQLEQIKQEQPAPQVESIVAEPAAKVKIEEPVPAEEPEQEEKDDEILMEELPIIDDDEEQDDENEEPEEKPEEVQKPVNEPEKEDTSKNAEIMEEKIPEDEKQEEGDRAEEITEYTVNIQEVTLEREEKLLVENSAADTEQQIQDIKKVTFSDKTVTVLGEKISSKSLLGAENTIADKNSNKKIDDIRHAISIGDRFRFQRELFKGNGEVMNKTLSHLNQSKDFDDALSYLKSKFDWNDEDETVESFYQIVKRRFL